MNTNGKIRIQIPIGERKLILQKALARGWKASEWCVEKRIRMTAMFSILPSRAMQYLNIRYIWRLDTAENFLKIFLKNT